MYSTVQWIQEKIVIIDYDIKKEYYFAENNAAREKINSKASTNSYFIIFGLKNVIIFPKAVVGIYFLQNEARHVQFNSLYNWEGTWCPVDRHYISFLSRYLKKTLHNLNLQHGATRNKIRSKE